MGKRRLNWEHGTHVAIPEDVATDLVRRLEDEDGVTLSAFVARALLADLGACASDTKYRKKLPEFDVPPFFAQVWVPHVIAIRLEERSDEIDDSPEDMVQLALRRAYARRGWRWPNRVTTTRRTGRVLSESDLRLASLADEILSLTRDV